MLHQRLLGLAGSALLACVLAAALAACGSSTTGSLSAYSLGSRPLKAGESSLAQKLYGKQRGGTLTVYDHDDFDHFDPGQAYFVEDYPVVYATQRPLYSYRPGSVDTLTPDLAAGPPKISHGGKTVTVAIRPGVHFSPPINREVVAADVAYAIERGANPSVANPYFQSYFGDIEGAEKATGGPIKGIRTPNSRTIVFDLTKPTAALLYGALSLPLSAPVPREMAESLDKHDPTTYGTEYLAATGPYMLKSDGRGKFLGIGYVPGQWAVLVRNPNWKANSDYRPAYLNRIDIKIGREESYIGHRVLKGKDTVQNDPPAQSIVKEAYERYPSQITFTPGAGDHYAALNNAHGPFRSVDLRRAVWAALDREAIVKATGGALTAAPMTQFISPGIPGFEQAGGAQGPKLDYNEHPKGDLKVATKYMKLAGYPGGKYTGGETLRVVGSTGEADEAVTKIVNQALEELGFKTDLILVEQATMYNKYCAVPAEEVDVCPNVGWGRDFADPQTILYVPFFGRAITKENNSNFGQVNDPQINAAMEKATLAVSSPARAQAWARVDRMLVEQAVAAPEEFDSQPNIEGSGVEGVNQLWDDGSWDYDFTSLKSP
jgi:peptide/nickel transport system substrate-binding protein